MGSDVTLAITFEPKPEKFDLLRAALQDIASAAVAEEGCLMFKVFEIEADPRKLYVFEQWSSGELFEKHQGTARSRTLLESLPELLAGAPSYHRLTPIGE